MIASGRSLSQFVSLPPPPPPSNVYLQKPCVVRLAVEENRPFRDFCQTSNGNEGANEKGRGRGRVAFIVYHCGRCGCWGCGIEAWRKIDEANLNPCICFLKISKLLTKVCEHREDYLIALASVEVSLFFLNFSFSSLLYTSVACRHMTAVYGLVLNLFCYTYRQLCSVF